jgi:CPA2 family monovalent cation:H+ antiporter-2
VTEFHLLNSIAVALALALAGGLLAKWIGLPSLVGYLAAGVVISPFTPGYDADISALRELAEIGVVFLMFGVGLHFNIGDLLRVRAIAIPGAIVQITVATALGTICSHFLGLDWREGLVLGLALSIASTVVLVRALEDRGFVESVHGRVAIGWLIVEDLATVIFLVLLPSIAPDGHDNVLRDTAIALGKATIFVALALFAGARIIPVILRVVARSGSRELFILTIVALALGIATGAAVFGLSVAIGAFIAGVVVSETETSHQAAADVVPLREAFAVLFFVSVGMLLDPGVLLDHVDLVLLVLAIVLIGKPLTAMVVTAGFPYPARTGLVVAAGLAQMGEFSFIIAQLGLDEGIITAGTYNVILFASVVSIALNPLAFRAASGVERLLKGNPPLWALLDRQGPPPEPRTGATNHVIIAGYGRVGELAGHALLQLGAPFTVIEANLPLARRLSAAGINVVWGDSASSEVLHMAGLNHARLFIVAVPDESSALLTVNNIRHLRPDLPMIVRAQHAGGARQLKELGATEVIVPEYEGGLEIMRQALVALGYDAEETLHFSYAVRDVHYADVEPHH